MAIDFTPSKQIDFKPTSKIDFTPKSKIDFKADTKIDFKPKESLGEKIVGVGKELLKPFSGQIPFQKEQVEQISPAVEGYTKFENAPRKFLGVPGEDFQKLKYPGEELTKKLPFGILGPKIVPFGKMGEVEAELQSMFVKDLANMATSPTAWIAGLAGKARNINKLKEVQKINAFNKLPKSEQTIIKALKSTKSLKKTQRTLQSIERAKRGAKLADIGKKIPGEKGFITQLKSLKGELPRPDFEGVRNKISQVDIDDLFTRVETSSDLLPFEKITTKKGLSKLLGAEGGTIPTEGELNYLRQVFSPEFIKTTLSKRPVMQKIMSGAKDIANIPRAMMATGEFSGMLRQGAFLIGRPKQFIPAAKEMFKYAFSQNAYDDLARNIKSRPTYKQMKESGLALTDTSGVLSQREEAFMSTLPEKIPIFGPIAKGSNRAYSGFLNKLRADVFDDILKGAKNTGVLNKSPEVVDDIANFVNTATGRGNLPESFERAAPILNASLFSPRLMASRLNLLNPAYYARLNPFVRKEAIKSLMSFAGTGATVLGLSKANGAEVSDEPTSADFGKIKIGKTRYDIWGGFQQYMVAASRLMSGEMVSSTTGKKTKLGEGYKATNRLDIASRFVEYKTAPVLSLAISMLRGKTSMGEDVDVPVEVADRFIPMIVQDIHDIYKEGGFKDIGLSAPAVFGVGMQTYNNQIPMVEKNVEGKYTLKWKQSPTVGEALINKATGAKLSNVPEEHREQLFKEKQEKTQQKIEFDKVKQQVLNDKKPRKYKDKLIYLERGVIKTRSFTPSSIKKIKNLEQQIRLKRMIK